MPHLRFRGLPRETVKQISKPLVATLSPLVASPADQFTLEFIPSEFVHQGQVGGGYPIVEVLWLERPLEIQDKVAEQITMALRAQVGAAQDICVMFTWLNGRQYYENGSHFG